MKRYDMVLIERPDTDGLSAYEVRQMAGMLRQDEFYPVDFESPDTGSSAMGFITQQGAEKIDYDYSGSGLDSFIGQILSDMTLENRNGEYTFKGVRIKIKR